MKRHLKTYSVIYILLTVIFSAVLSVNGQKKTFDIAQVRSAFNAAVAGYYDVIGDNLAGLESEKLPGAYWLVKVKPKKPGHYSLKYTYKYNDRFYTDGEYILNVHVGGTPCDRWPQSTGGIARFCLGDTVILPVRAANRYNYSFELKYTYQDPADSALKKPSAAAEISKENIPNPLASNLKFIGTKVNVMPHRSAGASTVEYHALFQAVSPGKFNIGISLETGEEPISKIPDSFMAGGGIPVVILEPGTAITYLAGREDTIDYADDKKFSSHGGGTFPTNLLVLQPGDIISIRFFSAREDERDPKQKGDEAKAAPPMPDIRKLPFYLNREISYNAFIAEYFPNGK